MVLVASAQSVILIGMKVRAYMEWPVETTTSVQFAANFTFPSLTICNKNALKKSILKQQPFLYNLMVAIYLESSNIKSNSSAANSKVCYIGGTYTGVAAVMT